jgi:hypothetical protein
MELLRKRRILTEQYAYKVSYLTTWRVLGAL